MEKIRYAMLVVTHACNLRCRYCFVSQKPETMTYQTAKDAVGFLLKNCEGTKLTPKINFFGGEPTLCWDSIIVPLTKYIREELKVPFNLGMTTNGTLLNKERIEFMKKYDINILLSIDGNQPTNDYNRPKIDGSSSFNDIPLDLISKNFKTTFRMTTIPETVSGLYNNILYAVDRGFNSFFVIPNVFQPWNDIEWAELTKQIHLYSNYYVDCYEKGITPISFSSLEKMFIKMGDIEEYYKTNNYRPNCESCKKCGLGHSQFASIHPSGDIYACQEMTSNEGKDSIFWIGNIYTGVEDERRQSLMDMFDKNKVYSDWGCDYCFLKNICDGGCVANNFLANGDVNKQPIAMCGWNNLLFREALYIHSRLKTNDKFMKEKKYSIRRRQ